MKAAKIAMGIALSLTVLLIGILAMLPLTACNNKPLCCAKIDDFRSMYDWVCPQCPDAGSLLFYKIIYSTDGKAGCEVGTEGCGGLDVPLMGIRNITENKGIPPNFVETSKGIYENPAGGLFVTLTKTSTFRLTATGNTGCPVQTKDIVIKAVVKGSRDTLCFPHNDLPPSMGFWTGKTAVFGSGVVIDSIQNPNTFTISVTLNGIKTSNLRANATSKAYQYKSPNGTWSLEIPNALDYQKQVSSKKSLCMIVYLTCKCK